MGMTLAQANYLSQDVFLAGVVETIVEDPGLLQLLPFEEVVGNAYTYNREDDVPTVAWRAVGDTWTEGVGTVSQKTAQLKIVGGDADIDNFLRMTRRNPQDLAVSILQAKAKAFKAELEKTFFYGDNGTDPLQPDGLHEIVDDIVTDGFTTQGLHAGSSTTAGVLTGSLLDQLIDAVRPGKPDVLMCSRRTRRVISLFSRSLTSPVTYEPMELGQRAMFWDGVPIIDTDQILDTETISGDAYALPTGGSATSIFAIQFRNNGVTGLRVGEVPTVDNWDKLELKDASRWRVKGYVGLMVPRVRSIARLDGISSGTMTA